MRKIFLGAMATALIISSCQSDKAAREKELDKLQKLIEINTETQKTLSREIVDGAKLGLPGDYQTLHEQLDSTQRQGDSLAQVYRQLVAENK
jgi:hypothetical protein